MISCNLFFNIFKIFPSNYLLDILRAFTGILEHTVYNNIFLINPIAYNVTFDEFQNRLIYIY